MTREELTLFVADLLTTLQRLIQEPATYWQLGIVAMAIVVAVLIVRRLRRLFPALTGQHRVDRAHPLARAARGSNELMVPLLATALLRISVDVSRGVLGRSWVVQIAMAVAMLLLFYSVVRASVKSRVAAATLLWLGVPLLALHFVGLLGRLIAILQSIALTVGSIDVSFYGVIRVMLFGSLLFWLGRISNSTGQDMIRRQQQLDLCTREIAADHPHPFHCDSGRAWCGDGGDCQLRLAPDIAAAAGARVRARGGAWVGRSERALQPDEGARCCRAPAARVLNRQGHCRRARILAPACSRTNDAPSG